MQLLFNDLVALRQRSGIGSYAHHLLEYLPAALGDLALTRLSETAAGLPLKAASRGVAGAGGGETARWKWLALKALDKYVYATSRFRRWDLYHEPDALPLRIAAPTVVTVHDLSVSLFPQWHPEHRVKKYETQLKRALDVTRYFFADSEATKRDMIKCWGVGPEKIQVVHLAPRPGFRKATIEKSRSYLLFVGTIEPRKNIAGLIRAYRSLPASLREDHPLFLAGGIGWGNEEIKSLLGSDVHQLGYLSDDELVALMNGATAMVYPSFYEGFGLPPLEAMACGVPVISSHRGSLAEVVGEGALIVEPEDEAAMAKAMTDVLKSKELRESLVRKGNEQLKKFSWEKTARETAEGYRRVLAAS